jgi:hypothetical protein
VLGPAHEAALEICAAGFEAILVTVAPSVFRRPTAVGPVAAAASIPLRLTRDFGECGATAAADAASAAPSGEEEVSDEEEPEEEEELEEEPLEEVSEEPSEEEPSAEASDEEEPSEEEACDASGCGGGGCCGWSRGVRCRDFAPVPGALPRISGFCGLGVAAVVEIESQIESS